MIALLHGLRGNPGQAKLLPYLQALQNQRRAFALHTRLGAGNLGRALGLVRHLLHQGQTLPGHGFPRQAPAVHAADGEVFHANGEFGVGQRAGGLLRGLDRVDLQALSGNARALLFGDFPCFGEVESVGLA